MDATSTPSHALTRWLFLRALGLVSGIAFLSFAVQADGLIGPHGILPYEAWLEAVGQNLGDEAFWRAPTVLWWAPGALDAVVAVGLLACVGLVLGLPFEGPLLLLAWVCYLSISTVGQRFMGFQWDTLLTETLFTSLFFARWSPRGDREPSRVGLWLLRLLLVKLMWLSGAVKLASGDPGWWDGLAMTYHYETQPLPNGLSWYAHHLPVSWHRLETWATVAIELLLPFAVFFGRWGRRVGAAGFTLVLGVLFLTGNYGFFQLLSLVLCLVWLDDHDLRRLPDRLSAWVQKAPAWEASTRRVRDVGLGLVAVGIVGAGVLQGAWRLRMEPPVPQVVTDAVHASRPFRSVNSYGLFANMTETRPEVHVEVSVDGTTWVRWPLPYKPGDLDRRPPQVAPHMPRLDWQLWFAALGGPERNRWVTGLLQRLAEGEPSVVALMGPYPLDEPPRFVRARVSDYRFSPWESEGPWWVSGEDRPFGPVVRAPAR